MIRIFDNFLADPYARREAALKADYEPVPDPSGALFPGIAQYESDDWAFMQNNLPGKPAYEFFRLTLANDKLPTFIHNDLSMARTTGILFLNEPETEAGGTAFWRHKEQNCDSINPKEDPSQYVADGLDETKWECRRIVEMRFNRLILFDSALWHSPFPRAGWGDSPANGRLIQVYFFP